MSDEERLQALEAATARLIDGVGQLTRQFFGISRPESLRAKGLDALAELLTTDRAREAGEFDQPKEA